MIKVEVNKGECIIREASGSGITIMSELCVIVRAVCAEYAQDEDDPKELCSRMMMSVAHALIVAEQRGWGADLEDDENDENDENASF